MTQQVVAVLDRVVVTVAFFALFGLVLVTHNMTGTIGGVMAVALGSVVTAWFGGHQTSAASAAIAQSVTTAIESQAAATQHQGQQG